MGGACGLRRPLHLGPAGPGPAPAEGAPAGLLRGQLHAQGEEAGKAGPTPLSSRTPACRPRGHACPPSFRGRRLAPTHEGPLSWAGLGAADGPGFLWQIWVGGTGLSQGRPKGKMYVIDAERKTVEKELVAHADTVKTLCSAEDRYVLSGAGGQEGKIAIWKVE